MIDDFYNLASEYKFLLDKDEYTDEDMQRLDTLHSSVKDTIINKCKLLKILEIKSENISKLIYEYNDKLDATNNKMDKLVENIKHTMEILNIAEVTDCPYFDIKLKKNNASVEDFNRDLIPTEYWRKKEFLSIDKQLIQDHIKNGKIVPGARLINKLRLEIK